ncbi:acyltransferase [Bacillus timonensis]|nr:acyltransferase [Bacillus timonensis]
MHKSDFNESRYITLIKSFAIISVICAHSAVIPNSYSYMNQIVSLLLHSIGSMGVPIFFIISGYLFNRSDKSLKQFSNGKVKTIIVPWVTCATVVWLYVVLRKGGISLSSWFEFVVGVKHSTYYLTVLLLFFLIYFYLKKNDIFLISTGILSIISITATSYSNNILNEITITPYLNPFNWMLYFSIGLLINKYNLLGRIAILAKRTLLLNIVVLITILYLNLRVNQSLSYWSDFAIINILISTFVILGLSSYLTNFKWNFLLLLGKYSFTIYLLHELVVGLIVNLSSRVDIWFITILRPVIILFIVMAGIIFYKQSARKLKFENKLLMLIGVNNNR